jgi:hypothetical protein
MLTQILYFEHSRCCYRLCSRRCSRRSRAGRRRHRSCVVRCCHSHAVCRHRRLSADRCCQSRAGRRCRPLTRRTSPTARPLPLLAPRLPALTCDSLDGMPCSRLIRSKFRACCYWSITRRPWWQEN